MSRIGRTVATLLLTGACGGSALADAGAVPRTTPVPTAAAPLAPCPAGAGTPIAGLPAMSLPCLADPDRAVAVARQYGRPEVINVWASWCAPCRREARALREAHRAYGDRVLFLGVDTRDDPAAARGFLAASGLGYAQLSDPPGALTVRLRMAGLPYTIVVDGSGHVAWRHTGEVTPDALRAALAGAGVPPVR